MRLEWIEDILAVHDSGSLRAAADLRFLTASAFTRRIKAVEEAMGSQLFDRSSKPVTLRPHVIELIPRMRELSAGLKQVQSELSGLGRTGQITRVICQHTLSVSWAPRVAKLLAQKQVQMRIKSGTKDECSLSVLKNDTDFAIIYEDPATQQQEEDNLFDRIFLANERFVPVAALFQNEELMQSVEAGRFPLIAYPRSLFLGEALEQALSSAAYGNIATSVVAEAGLGPAVLEFVREGVGVGWLPISLVSHDIKINALKDLSDFLPGFDLSVVLVRSKAHSTRSHAKVWKWIDEDFAAP